MTELAEQFGYSKELTSKWRSRPIFLKGSNDTLVILVHGWSLTPRQMLPLGKYLNKQGYHISLPLLSGHGQTPESLEKITWRDWVRDIVREIRKHKKTGQYKKIIIGGTSMGGNICLLASLQEKVDSIILIGVPVHFKNHFFFKLGALFAPFFKKYIKKRRPRGIGFKAEDSYQYFPSKNINQVLILIRRSVFSLNKIKVPILILQVKNDFFIAKYSPSVIYANVSSKIKKMIWLDTQSENHVPQGCEIDIMAKYIKDFLKQITHRRDVCLKHHSKEFIKNSLR